jgi:phosphatidylglycerophosphatase A
MKPTVFVAAGFGIGFAPLAPGTCGSLMGLAIGVPLLLLSPMASATAAIATGVIGIPIISAATGMKLRGEKSAPHDDPGWIVIDEIAGQMLALLALPRPSWCGIALAFLLFRLLDILKPGPIGWADRRGGALGIMADDVVAGAAACLMLLAGRRFFPLCF